MPLIRYQSPSISPEEHLDIIPPQVEIPPRESWSRTRALRILPVLGAAWLVSFILSPGSLERLPPLCPWKAFTGMGCPFCGLTHSVTAISHGRFHDALAWNPFGPVVYLAGLVLLALALFTWIKGHPPLNEHRLEYVSRFFAFTVSTLWALWWLTNTILMLIR